MPAVSEAIYETIDSPWGPKLQPAQTHRTKERILTCFPCDTSCDRSASLSHQIGKLESNIDVTIFDRSQNGLKITPAGRIVASYAENTLREWHMLVMARAVQRNQVPPLRLGFSSFVNAKLLERFRDGYERMFSG